MTTSGPQIGIPLTLYLTPILKICLNWLSISYLQNTIKIVSQFVCIRVTTIRQLIATTDQSLNTIGTNRPINTTKR